MINIGKYIEIAINWLTEHFARFFDVINDGVGGFIDAFQDGLTWIPFYVMILGLALSDAKLYPGRWPEEHLA